MGDGREDHNRLLDAGQQGFRGDRSPLAVRHAGRENLGGATTSAQSFLNLNTIKIVVLGLIAFCLGTAGGTLFGKLMYIATKGKVNPLIGSAGVSAVPMAARVSQKVGQKENPSNFLLMHAMGPNVSGVIGSAVAAGILLTLLK